MSAINDELYLSRMQNDIYRSVLSIGGELDIKKAIEKACEFELCNDIYQAGEYIGGLLKRYMDETGQKETNSFFDVVGLVYYEAQLIAESDLFNASDGAIDVCFDVYSNYLDTSFNVDADELKEKIKDYVKSQGISLEAFKKMRFKTTLAVLDECGVSFDEMQKELQDEQE